MKKIAFYIDEIHGGGAERVLSQLANQFVAHGYDCVMINLSKAQNEYELDHRVRRLFIEKRKHPNVLFRNIERIYNLRKACKREKPDVLLAFLLEPSLRSIIAGIGMEQKTVISIRSNPDVSLSSKIYKFCGKHVFPYADGCVFQTEEAKKWFPKKLQAKSAIIFNQVEEDFFATNRDGITDDSCVAIGNLRKEKDYETLIRAYQIVSGRFPEIKLNIYGEGKEREKLEKLIYSLHMENHVFLRGKTVEVRNVLKRARVYILSSESEGMPNALMEALAVGVPCVSTDCPCGGSRMLIQNGENGVLVPVKNENALGEAVCKLIQDKDYAEKLGKAAKERAQIFSSETVFRQWEKYILGRCEK